MKSPATRAPGLAIVLVTIAASASAQLKTNVQPTPSQQAASSYSAAEQTPAILASFPPLTGATRKWYSSQRRDVTWQDRAYYTTGGTPDSAASACAQQITAAGWTAVSRVPSGSAATKNYQITLDFTKGLTKAHLVVAQDSTQTTTLALALTTVFAKGAPALSVDVSAAPSSGATASAADKGSADPGDFPRLPGTVRTSFDSSVGASGTREAAAYTASSAPASGEAFYAQNLPGAGWSEIQRYEHVDDVARTQQLEMTWRNASRLAAIALSATGTSSTGLRVTLSTDTTGARVAAAPAATSATGARTTAQSAVTNLTVISTTATTATLSWTPPPGGASGYRLYQALGSGGSFVPIATVAAGANGYTVTGLIPDSAYSFELAPLSRVQVGAAQGGASASEGAVAGPVSAQTKPGLPPAQLAAWLTQTGALAASAEAERQDLPPPGGSVIDPEKAKELAAQQRALEQAQLKAAIEKQKAAARKAAQQGAPSPAPLSCAGTGAPSGAGASSSTSGPAMVNVTLTWPAAPEAAGYLVFRDGTPLQTTSPATVTSFTDGGVTTGTHTYTVASMFKTAANGCVEGRLTDLPKVTVPVFYGNYRVVLEQVIVNQPTQDTLLSTDGLGDEVYLTVDREVLSLYNGAIRWAPLRSFTYGQVDAKFTDRLKGGSASSTGGIRAGDKLPEEAGPCAARDKQHLCIPMEVYRGPLVKGMHGAYIAPRIWEWDGFDDSFSAGLAQGCEALFYSLGKTLQERMLSLQVNARRPGAQGFLSAQFDDIFPPNSPTGLDSETVKTPMVVIKSSDRPIGIASISDDVTKLQQTTVFQDQPILLSYELAEWLASGGQFNSALQPGQLAVSFTDTYRANGGSYTLIFRVTRCASQSGCG
jgi:hypothetical protein